MLPFLAGLAVGSALTILYAKRDEVKKTLSSPAFKDKLEQTKNASQQALSNVASRAKEIFANFSTENNPQKPKKTAAKATTKAEKSPRKRRTSVKAKEVETTPSKRTRKTSATAKSTKAKSTRAKSATKKGTEAKSTAKKATAKKTTAKKTTTRRGRARKTSEATNTNTALTNENTGAN